jgi:2-polyprenyl-3-methyl-5-hydroxy-6-metoxy-1,4-benzoquinol methylase
MNWQKVAQKTHRVMSGGMKFVARTGTACPSCGADDGAVVDRKKVITSLRRCGSCKLLYRTPNINEEENLSHYNDGGDFDFAARPPSDEQLAALLETGFRDCEGYLGSQLTVLQALGCKEGDRLLDFGCAWGYRSWQFARAGFHVQSLEINKHTCDFARTKLGVDAHSSLDELTPPFDVCFSNHVLEHVPTIRATIDRLWEMVRPGGLFVAFTPNGSSAARTNNYGMWHSMWGYGHPIFLDECFYDSVFVDVPKLMASATGSPYAKDQEALRKWAAAGQESVTLDLSGDELLIAVRKPA